MDANYFLSTSWNPFAKTSALEFPTSSSSSSSLHFPCSRRFANGSLFQPKRVRLSSSITSAGSSDDLQQHAESFLQADWRWFRAKMVANEQAFMTASTDPDENPKPPPAKLVTVGEKWAHTIHEPEKGCLLIATEKLDGIRILKRTVILLLSTGPAGPLGIILNRPSLMSIKEMRGEATTSAMLPEVFSGRPLFFGGPLEDGLFLVRPKGGYDKDRLARSGVFEEVMKGLYHGTKETAGCAAEMVKRNMVGVGNFRFFDGYCCWEAEQLKEEINAGYWTLAASSSSVIGLDKEASFGLWEDVSWLLGPKAVP
ncbi:unnamed protein product [Linum tenue]|uniref:Uncharacterized protein n=2 Tax=Linum tenue TaxID=586396 RepID=A0AAV0HNT5_9ROSI|nr:unnamed protein product [Linum tenue]